LLPCSSKFVGGGGAELGFVTLVVRGAVALGNVRVTAVVTVEATVVPAGAKARAPSPPREGACAPLLLNEQYVVAIGIAHQRTF
jgi:hypothetical protein